MEPTEKQVSFVHKLAHERVLDDLDQLAVSKIDMLDRRDVSHLIDRLLKAPKKPQASVGYQKKLEVGMYHTDGGEILRVYHGQQSGRLLVKRAVFNGSGYDYEYVGSAQNVLKGQSKLGPVFCERMSLEEAKNWGKMTGHCVVCGRKLDDPVSVEAGIGPVCKKNF